MAFKPLLLEQLRRRTGLGLYWEAAEISLVELCGHPRHGVHLQSYGSLELPTGAVVQGQAACQQETVDAARDLMLRCGVRSSRAVLAVPVRSVLLRTLTMPPRAGPQAWQDQARLEAAALLQSDPQDLCVDCEEVMPNRRGQVRRVATAAVRRERVEALGRFAQELGLELVAVEVDHHAAQRAVLRWCLEQRRLPARCGPPEDCAATSATQPLLIEFGRQCVRLSRPLGGEGVIEWDAPHRLLAPVEVVRLVERARAMVDGAAHDAVVLAGVLPPSAWVDDFRMLSPLPVRVVEPPRMGPWTLSEDSSRVDSTGAPDRPIGPPHVVAFGLALRSLSC